MITNKAPDQNQYSPWSNPARFYVSDLGLHYLPISLLWGINSLTEKSDNNIHKDYAPLTFIAPTAADDILKYFNRVFKENKFDISCLSSAWNVRPYFFVSRILDTRFARTVKHYFLWQNKLNISECCRRNPYLRINPSIGKVVSVQKVCSFVHMSQSHEHGGQAGTSARPTIARHW